jgi:hypothetical protein
MGMSLGKKLIISAGLMTSCASGATALVSQAYDTPKESIAEEALLVSAGVAAATGLAALMFSGPENQPASPRPVSWQPSFVTVAVDDRKKKRSAANKIMIGVGTTATILSTALSIVAYDESSERLTPEQSARVDKVMYGSAGAAALSALGTGFLIATGTRRRKNRWEREAERLEVDENKSRAVRRAPRK